MKKSQTWPRRREQEGRDFEGRAEVLGGEEELKRITNDWVTRSLSNNHQRMLEEGAP